MTNLYSDKGLYTQSYGLFSSHVQMWELDHKEGWMPKHWCFWTVVLGRLFRVPWTARRSNQSSLREINPENSLEGLMLKLNLQYFGHLMRRADSLEKTLMMREIEGKRRKGRRVRDSWMASLIQWTRTWVNFRRWWGTGRPGMLQPIRSETVGHDFATEQQQQNPYWWHVHLYFLKIFSRFNFHILKTSHHETSDFSLKIT